jgi:transposase
LGLSWFARSGGPGRVRWRGCVVGRTVEGDSQLDLDVEAAYADFLDDETEELLAAFEVESVDGGGDGGGKGGDALAELVVGGERGPLFGECLSLLGDLGAPSVEFTGPAFHFGQVDEPALVEVGEAAAFGVGAVELAVEAGQFGAEQFVVGHRSARRDCGFPGRENVGCEQRVPDLVEHEAVEGVGSDVAFGASTVLASGAERVVGIPPSGGHLSTGFACGRESLMGRQRRRFSPEFKRDAVALLRSSGKPISQVARELGVGETSLGNWVGKDRAERALVDPERFAAEVAESEEVKRLRRRVSELEVEREILKRSMVFWVKESNG